MKLAGALAMTTAILALEVPGTCGRNEWLEPVDDAAYAEATGAR